MRSPHKIVLRTPQACAEDILLTFTNLVKSSEEVEERGLEDRVKRAVQIAMIYNYEEIVGTGGVKTPNKHYHCSVFRKAKTDLAPDDYPFELGWLYIKPCHRRLGLGGRIVDELMTARPGKKIFSTCRTDNQAVRQLLEKKGFTTAGTPYISNRDGKTELILYVQNNETWLSGIKQ